MTQLRPPEDVAYSIARMLLKRYKVALSSPYSEAWGLSQVRKTADIEHASGFYFMDGSVLKKDANGQYTASEKYAVLESTLLKLHAEAKQNEASQAAQKIPPLEMLKRILNYKIPVEPEVWANSIASILMTEIKIPSIRSREFEETDPDWEASKTPSHADRPRG